MGKVNNFSKFRRFVARKITSIEELDKCRRIINRTSYEGVEDVIQLLDEAWQQRLSEVGVEFEDWWVESGWSLVHNAIIMEVGDYELSSKLETALQS